MMKSVILTIGLLSVAGCTTMEDREARCSCFNSDGTPSGACNFEPLPGQPAVFSFAAIAPVAASAGPSSDLTDGIRRELCGG